VVRGYPSQEMAEEARREYLEQVAERLPATYVPRITICRVVVNSEPLLYFNDPEGVYE